MKNILGFLGLAFVLGCTSTGDRVAYRTVERTIVPGRSTQNEVIRLMGSPNLVTKNAKGEEVWTYNAKTYNPETGKVDNGVILSGGTKPSTSGKNTAVFDLILTFDAANVVRDYSVLSSDF